MVETLINKTKAEYINLNCGNCSKNLKIPLEVYNKVVEERTSCKETPHLRRGYDSFYVNDGWNFYCNKTCFNTFTED